MTIYKRMSAGRSRAPGGGEALRDPFFKREPHFRSSAKDVLPKVKVVEEVDVVACSYQSYQGLSTLPLVEPREGGAPLRHPGEISLC